jgi:hypothetical protein
MQAVFVCNNRETAQIAAKGNYIAWAQDVYPEECASHMSSLRKTGTAGRKISDLGSRVRGGYGSP